MNFLIYGGEEKSSTDGIIYRGITNILDSIYTNNNYSYLPTKGQYSRDFTLVHDNEFYPYQKFDAIIIPGSPFLWHYFHKTPKIHNLLRCKELHPEAKVIWFGIGSCLPLDKEYLLNDNEHLTAIKQIFGNDLIFVRDHLAKNILDLAGLNSSHILCPSYYSDLNMGQINKSNDALLVWYEPSIGVSKCEWQDNNKLQEYYRKNIEFYQKYKPDVVCKDIDEVKYALDLGLSSPRVLKDDEDTLLTVSKYDKVLSGRIHIAVPALITGCNTQILPIDTRYYTISDYIDCVDGIKKFEKDQGYYDILKKYQNDIDKFLK